MSTPLEHFTASVKLAILAEKSIKNMTIKGL